MSRQLASGWAEIELGDYVYIAGRIGWRGLKADEYTSAGPIFLSVPNLNHGDEVNFEKVHHISKARYDESPEIQLRVGDTLLVKDGAGIGKLGFVENLPAPATVNSSLLVVRPANGLLTEKYLFYYLKGPQFQEIALKRITGSATPHLFQKDIKKLRVLVAPLSEQRRIAARLKTLLGKVNVCQQLLAKIPRLLKRFRQSVLAAACSGRLTADWRDENPSIESAKELVARIRLARPQEGEQAPDEVEPAPSDELPDGWVWTPLWEVLKAQNGRSFPSKEYTDNGVRLLRPGNLNVSGSLEWNEDNTAHLPSHWAENYPDFVLERGDLLMNLTAQSLKDEFLGRVCLKTDELPALLNQRICRFRMWSKDDLRPFIFRYFKSPRFRFYVNTLDTGSLIRHMHTKQVLGHVAPLPPLAEQREIVRRVEQLFILADQLEVRFAKAQGHVDKLTQSFLAKAFRGELVPQDPNDEPASALLARIRSSVNNAEKPERRQAQAFA